MHAALGGAELSSPDGQDVRTFILHDFLDLAIDLTPFVDVGCGIKLIQKGVEFFVAIERFGPGGTAAERQVYICSRRMVILTFMPARVACS